MVTECVNRRAEVHNVQRKRRNMRLMNIPMTPADRVAYQEYVADEIEKIEKKYGGHQKGWALGQDRWLCALPTSRAMAEDLRQVPSERSWVLSVGLHIGTQCENQGGCRQGAVGGSGRYAPRQGLTAVKTRAKRLLRRCVFRKQLCRSRRCFATLRAEVFQRSDPFSRFHLN